MRRATTNQSSGTVLRCEPVLAVRIGNFRQKADVDEGVPDDRRRKTFDEHVDVMLVHFKDVGKLVTSWFCTSRMTSCKHWRCGTCALVLRHCL